MDNKTVQENNTMQFKPNKNDCINIYEFTMVKCNSYYFSTSTRKLFNSKIKRALLIDTSEDRKNSKSNLFSIYGSKPYDYKNIITVLIEEVQHFYDDEKEYKLIVLHNNKMLFNKGNNLESYKDAKEVLNNLEEKLKTNLSILEFFK
jgi:hypothetical protein